MSIDTSYTILIVDDNVMILDVLADALRCEGHHVLTTTTGKDVVSICRAQQIHLIILDYTMPGITGEEVVRAVREFEHDVQIVMQTGQDLIPPRKLLRELDIQGYHSKDETLSKLFIWIDVALKNYEQIRSRRMIENSLLVLGLALEARDLETAGHTKRVVGMAERMGQHLDLTNWHLESLRQGAYLHDLGKLCIPDAVLLKPQPLDPQEWAIMQTHTQRGFELASNIPGIRTDALAVILHHHEHWDGSGYPTKLAGAQIPQLARIFTICDVYDALLSKRPYKSAWIAGDAIQELQQQRNAQFEPALVDLFVNLWSSGVFADLHHVADQVPAVQLPTPPLLLPVLQPVTVKPTRIYKQWLPTRYKMIQ